MTDLPDGAAAPAEQAASAEAAAGAERGADGATRREAVRRLLRGAASALRRVTLAQIALLVAIALYTLYFTRLSLSIHHGMGTGAFDFGLYDQGMWLLSRFKAPFVTLMGRNLFGDHTSFILLPLVPLYWVHSGAGTLFLVQSAAIAAGAIPVFLYARRRLGNEAVALALALGFLLNPALQWANLEGFHPDAFLSGLLGFAIYAALTERWRMYVLFVILVALVKEDTWLVLMPLGAWVALRRRPEIGLLTIAASAVYPLVLAPLFMASLTGVSMPNAWRIPYGGPGGLFKEIVERPGNVLSYLRSEGRLFYVWQMATPFAWAFLRLPSVALIGILALGANVVSTFAYQHLIGYHYSVVLVPALALGTVHALGAMKAKWRGFMPATVVAMSVWSALLWGPLPFARTPPIYWPPNHPAAVAAREVIDDIPAGASVSAWYGIAPHLTHREQIYMFPTPFKTTLYGPGLALEGQRLPAADTVEYVVLPVHRDPEVEKAWQAVPDAFTLVQVNPWWEVYRRTDTG